MAEELHTNGDCSFLCCSYEIHPLCMAISVVIRAAQDHLYISLAISHSERRGGSRRGDGQRGVKTAFSAATCAEGVVWTAFPTSRTLISVHPLLKHLQRSLVHVPEPSMAPACVKLCRLRSIHLNTPLYLCTHTAGNGDRR